MSVAIPPRPPIKSTEVFKKDIFEGKVLFCTGGPSGICKAMTKSIMSHGADAIIIGRKVDKGEAAAKELNVREPEQLKAAAKKCIDTFGKIDFVICGTLLAAGNFLAPISGLSENAFATVVRIDTLGTFNTIKATLPHVRRTRGSYIHVSATLHYYAHVSAAKAEEGPRGVRSNVIAPGPILGTEGMDRLTPVGKKDAITRSVPLQRQGGLDDVPNTAVFLFSEAANWVTGQIIAVDGGAMHTNKGSLPYPDSVLDPEGATKSIRAKM
ncbi:NAD-binding protein [Cantharellus anzutake]|uniref:NAD-binding protein n=1 Tax=Cantharellus anzutake TaxID=1750568 RepID=UPI001903D66C|nr:NAD-binding protein [Cantharellus anzutake]KAF8311430.1 NAD-binding protein [Cantharellus anzutake]